MTVDWIDILVTSWSYSKKSHGERLCSVVARHLVYEDMHIRMQS